MLVTLFYDFMGSPLPTRGQCIHRALPTRCVLLSFSSTTDSYSKFLRIVLQLKKPNFSFIYPSIPSKIVFLLQQPQTTLIS